MQRIAGQIVLIGVALLGGFFVFMVGLWWYGHWQDARMYAYAISDGVCNVAVIPLQGDIVAYDSYTYGQDEQGYVVTSGDSIERYIRSAESEPGILGIVLQIDSYGGSPAPAGQIMSAMQRTALPTVAYIREVGTSGAYLAATGADTIISTPYAEIGSIGITYSYVQYARQNERDGIDFVELASGRYKDAGNPNKPLTEDERALYQRNVNIFHNLFVSAVAQNRQLPVEAVEELADGSSMPAEMALELGLIDAVGDETLVQGWFAATLGLAPEEVVLCK